MTATLAVKPAGDRRRALARWVAPQGVRMRSAEAFAIPVNLFPEIPEDLLVGALVDDQPYTSPEE